MTIEEVWYGRSGAARLARAALLPASLAWSAAARIRGALYEQGVLARRRAPAPVVSIGALAAGGSGKTPFVAWLAGRLVAAGLRPCIVLRGYGGTAPGPLLVDAREPGAASRAGDEAVLLALRTGVPVVVGADRLAACELAYRELAGLAGRELAGLAGRELAGAPPQLFLLDDGFQHRALARDLDVVLLGSGDETAAVLPAGPLRESPAALARADFVLRVRSRPTMLVGDVADAEGEDPRVLAGRRVVAVAAIAKPERFLADLERLGAVVTARVLRRDHHRFDADDRREIDEAARDAELVVTTEKDLVRLADGGAARDPRLRALRIEAEADGADRVLARVLDLVRAPAI